MSLSIHKHNYITQNTGWTRGLTFLQLSKLDPSKTITIQRDFTREFVRRFLWLKQMIRGAIVDKDIFGIKESDNPLVLVVNALPNVKELLAQIKSRQFAFQRSDKKIQSFMNWLEEMEEKSILEIEHRPGAARGMEQAWNDVYIRHAYQKGIARAKEELRAAGYTIPSFSPDAVQDVAIAFNQPIHSDRAALAYTRSFTDLKGITKAMDTQISRVLADGLAAQYSPLKIARNIVDRVDKIGLSRAKMLARTEVVRAHHAANMAEYKQAQAVGVKLVAEWVTAGNPCEKCQALANKKYFKMDDAENMLPLHPNCRCAIVPVPMDFIESEEAKKIRRRIKGNELQALGGKSSGIK
jgi:SPP1 gp7 family putative phage head morphogenesis protein